ncbi:hypothetical protein THARTR1_01422 [Trichoderma harzianum]|uniref:Major facilitator superfamily (MFS) profile domain-containing protein n=1 Tax=Trichoderma harzianum TaxID=5544 RepID=A0A2K0UN39_TRIHA|nr:hypothetical protein THARTR1_01422 [Trichoderma harzianum]
MPAVISGRLLQGLGGGGLDVLGEIIVADITVLKERPTYLGIMAIPTAVGSILGPSLGALLCHVASVLAAGSSAALVGPLKGYRWSIWISWFLVTLGTGLLALLSVSSSKAMGFGIPIMWGWGVGALLRVPQLPIQASVANINDTGLVIGLMMFLRLLGGLVGLAISSSVFSNVFEPSISKIIPYLPAELQQLGDANMAIGFSPKLRTLAIPAELLLVIQKTYSDAFRAIFFAMTGASGLGLLSSLATEELTLDKEERGQQQFDST